MGVFMKRILLAAASLAALTATPAVARDHSAYFGIEVGPMWAQDSNVSVEGLHSYDINHNLGVDGDLIAGYDFGLFRAEIEGSHKWAKHDKYDLNPALFEGLTHFDSSGHSRAYSIMGNAMIDLGKNEAVNFYLGGGVGVAWVRQKIHGSAPNFGFIDYSLEDSGLAWQGIAGVRAPVFRYFDIGLKYRYFHAGRIKDEVDGFGHGSRFRSHSLLVSLIYNYAEVAPPPPPPPPPAPPPPPPATQTCADGSVILVTDACPAPPPPPPPPPPTPERGN
jgi:OOP family OmpA-OmpF porin